MLLGIIGYPIKHSISPKVHETLMRTYGIEGHYLAFEVKPGDVRDLLLVTILQTYPFLTSISSYPAFLLGTSFA